MTHAASGIRNDQLGSVRHLALVAGTCALAFGLLEGVAHAIIRRYPVLRASNKVSLDVLWVAPAIDLVLFVVGALMLAAALRAARVSRGELRVRMAVGLFTGLGALAVIHAPAVLHPASALLLVSCVGVAAARATRGREVGLLAALRRRAPWLAAVVIAAAVATSAVQSLRERSFVRGLPSPAPGALNVLVIVLDTFRRDRVMMDGGQTLTPSLDRALARGIWFSNAWAASSWSLPSHASILTGRYPHEHGGDWPTLALRAPTLADHLASRGYATVAVSSNASWVTPEYLGSGFARFDAYRLEDLMRRTTYGSIIGRALWSVGLHYAGRGKPAERLGEELLSFIDDHPDRPFFAYACFMDVNRTFHHRIHNRPLWAEPASPAQVIAAYDSGVRALDADVGAMLDELAKRGILERTIVIVTSDHGESFGAAGNDREPAGHGTSLYPVQARVPLIVMVPEGEHARGDTISTTVSSRAVPATVLSLLGHDGHEFGNGLPMRGMEDGAEGVGSALLTLHYEDRDLRSLVRGWWQYIETNGGAQEELYDLGSDPRATRNLAGKAATATMRFELERAMRHGVIANGGAEPR